MGVRIELLNVARLCGWWTGADRAVRGREGLAVAVFNPADMEAAVFWVRTARSLNAVADVDEAFRAIIRLATPTVPGAEHAGLTVMRRDGTVSSAAVSDDVVLELDRLQQDLDGGPCLEAMHGERVVRIDDMAAEQRWPRFAADARELGIGSMLSCRMATSEGTTAALNFHAADRAVFDDATAQIAAIYTAHAAIAVSNAELVEALRRSAHTRQTIGEATGILMERHKVTSRQGFEMLVSASQAINVKVREIAEFVVATGEEPRLYRSRWSGAGG